jgi:glycosyltransferase 2 family protein
MPSPSPTFPQQGVHKSRRGISRPVRWGIMLGMLLLVGWFAGGTVISAWNQLAGTTLEIGWGWVLTSAVLYGVGLFPMACFWRLALARLGQHPPWFIVLRGYYLGHLGKYVPGKALVVLFRTGTLVAAGCSARATMVSVFLETLTFMATGAATAAVLIALRGEEQVVRLALAAGLALVAGLPITPPIARYLARRVAGTGAGEEQGSVARGIDWHLTAWGVAAALISWCVLGLSLWAAVRSIGIDSADPLRQLPLWVGSVTLPVVAGFLSLLPGGLGVRDTLLVQLLAPAVPLAASALVVAALWRIISLVSELAVCGIIECSRLYRPPSPSHHDTP